MGAEESMDGLKKKGERACGRKKWEVESGEEGGGDYKEGLGERCEERGERGSVNHGGFRESV